MIRWTSLPRHLRATPARFYSIKLSTEYTPGPPRLPKEQQEEFERLQHIANSQAAIDEYNAQMESKGYTESTVEETPKVNTTDIGGFQSLKIIPEFEGDVNPKTGERGGPKQDPQRYSKDEWTFNGRVVDF
ncbi:putative mitochondrial protein, conserved [Scheffersomyces spartinae]|uniref:Succinate dehydrogenase assembly factor 4, mitochondrial n=1 Tax=Scheffersomyces spartinae TaxID=45513 RepID=A0A9P7V623_9ASCO|nr:putative mitochondrial protein, conserved [Scheffersomyces spartinae]KAG7192053.1 putative mitochondrial protein, conserved [Scheffersomyces spartinae]